MHWNATTKNYYKQTFMNCFSTEYKKISNNILCWKILRHPISLRLCIQQFSGQFQLQQSPVLHHQFLHEKLLFPWDQNHCWHHQANCEIKQDWKQNYTQLIT